MKGKGRQEVFRKFIGLEVPAALKIAVELRAHEQGRTISSVVKEILVREFGHGQKEKA